MKNGWELYAFRSFFMLMNKIFGERWKENRVGCGKKLFIKEAVQRHTYKRVEVARYLKGYTLIKEDS